MPRRKITFEDIWELNMRAMRRAQEFDQAPRGTTAKLDALDRLRNAVEAAEIVREMAART